MEQWYYAVNGITYGPLTGKELRQHAMDRQFDPDDHVFREDMTDWVEARTIRGLFPRAVTPPPLPPPLPPLQSRGVAGSVFDFTDSTVENDESTSAQKINEEPEYDQPEPGQADFRHKDGFWSRCARCGVAKEVAEDPQVRTMLLRRPFSMVGSFVLGYLPVNYMVYSIYRANGIGGLIPAWIGIALALAGGSVVFRLWNRGMPQQPVKLVFCRPCRTKVKLFVATVAILLPCLSWLCLFCHGTNVDRTWLWRWYTRIRILDSRRGILRLEFRNQKR